MNDSHDVSVLPVPTFENNTLYGIATGMEASQTSLQSTPVWQVFALNLTRSNKPTFSWISATTPGTPVMQQVQLSRRSVAGHGNDCVV